MSENAPLRLGVVIDYQNVHLVAADLFMPSRPVQESLIDPYRRMVPIRQTRREKGVDVLCALTLVDMARSGLYDVVVLASWDRDLAPALDHADRASRTKVEAAKWHSPSQPDSDGFLRTTRRLWTTPMTKKHFQASLDPRSIDDRQLHPATRRDMVS